MIQRIYGVVKITNDMYEVRAINKSTGQIEVGRINPQGGMVRKNARWAWKDLDRVYWFEISNGVKELTPFVLEQIGMGNMVSKQRGIDLSLIKGYINSNL